MANNFDSFNRFTALPANISDYGAGLEELRLLKGKPEVNPAIVPMAVPRRSRKFLALESDGSDTMRLSEPAEPEIDPYEGPRPTLSLSRASAQKLSGGILDDLHGIVQGMGQGDTRALMLDSFQRIDAMRDLISERNEMTEGIYVRFVAAKRG